MSETPTNEVDDIPDSPVSELLELKPVKPVGILDLKFEEIKNTPKFTESETLKALEILGYSPEDLVVPDVSEFNGQPEIQQRVFDELEAKRNELFTNVIKMREEVIRREEENLPSPTIKINEIKPTKATKKKHGKKKVKHAKTVDGEEPDDNEDAAAKPKKKKKKRIGKARKALTIQPEDRIRVKEEEKKRKQRMKELKELEKRDQKIEERLKNIEKERKAKAAEIGMRLNRKVKNVSVLREKKDKEQEKMVKKTILKDKTAEKRRQQMIAKKQEEIKKRAAEEQKKRRAVEEEMRKREKERQKKMQEMMKREEERAKKIELERKQRAQKAAMKRHSEVMSKLALEARLTKKGLI